MASIIALTLLNLFNDNYLFADKEMIASIAI